MINKKIKEFINCLDEQKFYEAHEALEEVWFPRRFEESNEVKLLKGFINASVSFELLKKGKVQQSKKVWLIYLKYRQLLYKTDSEYFNDYHKLARHVETTWLKLIQKAGSL
jgi:hypothetical protein